MHYHAKRGNEKFTVKGKMRGHRKTCATLPDFLHGNEKLKPHIDYDNSPSPQDADQTTTPPPDNQSNPP